MPCAVCNQVYKTLRPPSKKIILIIITFKPLKPTLQRTFKVNFSDQLKDKAILFYLDYISHTINTPTKQLSQSTTTITSTSQSTTPSTPTTMSSFTSSKSSSKTMSSDGASTHSTVSTATTLKGIDSPNKKKWYSLSSKSEPKHANKSDAFYAKQAVHNEAVASYFSMR